MASGTTYTVTICNACSSADPTPPAVHWVATVADEQVYTASKGTVQLEASATDNVAVQRVDFKRWDQSSQVWLDIGTDNTSPYQASLNIAALNMGRHPINAVAVDSAGNWATQYISVDPGCSVTRLRRT